MILQIAGNITVEQLQAAVAQLGLTLLASREPRHHRIDRGAVPHHRRQDARRTSSARWRPSSSWPSRSRTTSTRWNRRRPPTRRRHRAAIPVSKATPRNTSSRSSRCLDVHRMVRGANITIAVIDSEIDVDPSRSGRRGGATLQRGGRAGKAARPRHRHGGRHGRAPEGPGHRAGRAAPCRACVLHQRRQGREHHVQYPQGHRLGGGPGRARHQYELRRPEGSLAPARAQARLRQGHRAGRRRRQCRARNLRRCFPAPIPS